MSNSANKILVIVESIDVDDSSASKMNVAIIKNLKQLGYNLQVFHYTRKQIQLEDIKCVSIIELKTNGYYLLSRFQRLIQRLLKLNFSNALGNLFGFSFTYINDVNSISKAVNEELKTNSYELIITLSKGASFRVHKAVLKIPTAHAKWMAYIHDPYPFCYYPKPYDWHEPGYKKKIIFFKKVSESAKYSAFPSQLLKEWMSHYFPSFENTALIIPHQINHSNINIKELPTFYDETKFNLLHAGNLLKQRDPKGLIEGYQLFLERNPDAKNTSKLLFLGPASYHEKMLLENCVNCPQIFWSKGNVPFDIVYTIQQKANVNIIMEAKAAISPFLPGKFPHCVTAKKPILHLGPENSETRRLLGKQYPYVSEIDQTEDIANAITHLYLAWSENKEVTLDRSDLENYVGLDFLNTQIKKCLT